MEHPVNVIAIKFRIGYRSTSWPITYTDFYIYNSKLPIKRIVEYLIIFGGQILATLKRLVMELVKGVLSKD